ncbi:hypothetical protein I917_02935 [Mycobacterium tuberculosis str. Haarlem/NITR202]|uniref:Uncharacterized protein n=1 Tax=Mycobacterium tuberculosis str. Haarlem/NITR202 TaxID=1304279 RepID=R4LUJ7_MYCTX|nr:hypothetical protein I917_02935 [Mycobacterium tuberculosis str. Haarlem/NITR202]
MWLVLALLSFSQSSAPPSTRAFGSGSTRGSVGGSASTLRAASRICSSVTSLVDRPDNRVTALVSRAVVKCREVGGTSSSVRTAPTRSPSADRALASPKAAEITPSLVLHTV